MTGNFEKKKRIGKIGGLVVLGMFAAIMLTPLGVAGDDDWTGAGLDNMYATYLTDEVGIGTTSPDRKLDVEHSSYPQLRLTQSNSVFTDFQTTSSGYLYINPSGNRVDIAGSIFVSQGGDVTIKEGAVSGTQGDLNLFMDYDVGYIRVDRDYSGGARGNLLIEANCVGIGAIRDYKLHVEGDVHASGSIIGTKLNSGLGDYELYAMNQNVQTTDPVTFATINTGYGACEIGQNLRTTDGVTFATINTGYGACEIGQNLRQTDPVTFATIDTGYGAFEIGNNLRTTDNPTFNRIYLQDYGYALGGFHVGGDADPGEDNLMVDGDAIIGDDLLIDDNLFVLGGTYITGIYANIYTVNTHYPIAADSPHFTILVDTRYMDVQISLPNAEDVEGRILVIKKITSANEVIIVPWSDPYDDDLINGQNEKRLGGQWDAHMIQSDGDNWFTLAENSGA